MRFSLHPSVPPLIMITEKRITHIKYDLNKKRHDLKNREFSASTISDVGETTLIGLKNNNVDFVVHAFSVHTCIWLQNVTHKHIPLESACNFTK